MTSGDPNSCTRHANIDDWLFAALRSSVSAVLFAMGCSYRSFRLCLTHAGFADLAKRMHDDADLNDSTLVSPIL
jgi:hypothetical protein